MRLLYGDEDENSPITFIRGVNLVIEVFFDLANQNWSSGGCTSSSRTPSLPQHLLSYLQKEGGKADDFQPQVRSSKWLAEDAQWALNEDFDWYYYASDKDLAAVTDSLAR